VAPVVSTQQAICNSIQDYKSQLLPAESQQSLTCWRPPIGSALKAANSYRANAFGNATGATHFANPGNGSKTASETVLTASMKRFGRCVVPMTGQMRLPYELIRIALSSNHPCVTKILNCLERHCSEGIDPLYFCAKWDGRLG
jgi:hypothetical protein